MNYNSEVELVTLKNIQDKDMYYVRIKNNNGSEIISIGQKTYDRIYKLTTGTPTPIEMKLMPETKKDKK